MAHRLIHLAIYQGGVCAEETPADLTLLWNFGPEAELRTEDETFALRRDDVVSLRPQQRYSLRTGEGPVAAVALDGAQLRACLGGRRLAIRCNSAREVSDNYAILRGLLGQVLQAWAEGGPYLEAELGKLYYELALLLANCFGVDLPGEPGTRAEQFTRYLEDHCREELSLQQISEAFHMTPQYFSRQFKAQTGQNFYRSLTAVRLRRAKQDLAETDTPLLRLALDNGFANLESFYHYFQEDTGQTPQAWRAEHRRAETAAALPVLRELVGSLHLEAPAAAPQEEVFAVDAAVRRSYHPFWREVLHLGDAALLDNSLIAGQLRTLQEELHFRFIRIRADCRAFTAGSATDYEILLAPAGQYYRTIDFSLYNEMGDQVWESGTNDDGSVTVRQVQLSPQTTYYGAIEQLAGNKGSLIFRVSSHITQPDTAAEIQRETETVEELVFEEPFSLDETQIMFVSNKAIFVDEEAAKAALAPVAEVILAHPDHPILLAGTTATDGEQESCVRLSSQRAEAVKNLLVSAYGVPADQLLTVGLGYAADPFPRGQDRDSKGNFVESEAVKNRRVVVLDANDPTAQAILNA